MKTATKSSITPLPEDLTLILALRTKLKVKSKIEVIRRGLHLLKETTDRASPTDAYRSTSA